MEQRRHRHIGPTPSIFIFLLSLSSFLAVAARQGQFLLITDFHIDPNYDRHGNRTEMCHRERAEPKKPNETPKNGADNEGEELGKYGDRKCDSPQALVEYMLDEAKRQIPNPDFIIWTGDTPAHIEYTDAEFLQTMENAAKLVKQRFAQIPVIPVLGNHDMSPPNNFPDNEKHETSLYSNIFELWKSQGWIDDSAKDTFLQGGYYHYKSGTNGTGDYLVLNTNMYYMINRAIQNFTHPDDPTGQFAFLEQQLTDVKRKNGFVHIVSHLPPGAYEWDSYGTEWNPIMPPKYNQRLVDIFVAYAPWIRWMLFGHLHTDTFRIIRDSSGKPVQRMFLSPAVTPMFELNNPAFRVFEFNTASSDIVDIKTFYVDLDELNREGADKVQSRLEYSMHQEYGLDSFDAAGMDDLLQRMARNETLFGRYIQHNKVMHASANANGPDRHVHLCVIGNLDLDRLEQCTSTISAAAGGMVRPAMFALFASLFLILHFTARHIPFFVIF